MFICHLLVQFYSYSQCWTRLVKKMLNTKICTLFPLLLLEAGISNYLNQNEKYSNGSNEGPIYSTIDPAAEDLRSFSAQYSQHTTPYASTPIMPFTNQTPCSPDQDGDHWINQPGTSSVQYAQPDRAKADNGI